MKARQIREYPDHGVLLVIDEHGHEQEARGTIPDKDKITTFEVSFGNNERTVLVLDPYGDDDLGGLRKKIFSGVRKWTVGVDRKSGAIFLVTLESQSENGVTLAIQPWMSDYHSDAVHYRIPGKYRDRLGELWNKKRPYSVYASPHALQMFVDREEGYEYLRHNVVFSFAFDDGNVEVLRDNYRVVGRWEVDPHDP